MKQADRFEIYCRLILFVLMSLSLSALLYGVEVAFGVDFPFCSYAALWVLSALSARAQ